jgi:hypothetical protein
MATVSTTKPGIEVAITLNKEEVGALYQLLANTGVSILDDLFESLYDINDEFDHNVSWKWNGSRLTFKA